MHLAVVLDRVLAEDLDRVVVPGQGQVLVPDQVLDQMLAVESALDLELELGWVWVACRPGWRPLDHSG